MTLLTLSPLGILIPVLIIALLALKKDGVMQKNAWIITTLFSVVFTTWTLVAFFNEGVIGLWTTISQSFWDNQVWFDLLFALSIGWILILPRAKAAGMNLVPWFLFTFCSGSVGFSAMFARLLFLEKSKP